MTYTPIFIKVYNVSNYTDGSVRQQEETKKRRISGATSSEIIVRATRLTRLFAAKVPREQNCVPNFLANHTVNHVARARDVN